MDLFKRIQDLSAIYDDDGPSAMVPESRPMFNDGGRIGFLKGRLVQKGPNTGKYAVSYQKTTAPKKQKAVTEYFDNEELANNFIEERKKNWGGKRDNSGKPYKAGKKITFTPKQVEKINADLPNGIKLRINEQGNAVWQARKTAGPDNVYNKSFAVTNKNPLKDEGLNLIKQEVNTFIDTYLPNRITKEKFEQLRYLDENINLTQTEFAEKLNKLGYTSISEGKPLNQRTVSRLDNEIGNIKYKSYTLAEQTQFLKNSLDPNEFKEIKNLDLPKDQKESLIRKRANEIRSRDARLNERGVFARGNSREAKLFSNLYQAHTRSNRILIGGEFNGKDLSKRKNWPRDADGNVNWGAKGADGQPAWKSVVFTDTQSPKGPVKLTYNNLKNQVDDAFGPGHFTRSTTAYVTQTQAYKDLGGKDIAKKNIIANYKKKYNGKIPSDAYVEARIANEAPGQVHHWAEGGIGSDPYKVQFVSKSANQAVGNAEKTYKKELRQAGGNPNKIKLAQDNFKKTINQISNEMGGIKYTVGGQTVGKASTVESAYGFEKKGLGKYKIPGSTAPELGALNLPSMYKKLGSVGRKVVGFGTGLLSEKLFFDLDKNNMISKGMSEQEAAAQAAENLTFGLYQNKAYMDNLKKTAESMGVDTSAFDSAYNLNVLNKQYAQNTKNVQEQVDTALLNNDQKTADDLIKNFTVYSDRTKKEYERLENDITGRISGGSPQIMSNAKNFLTDEQFAKPFYDMQDAAIEKLKREKLKAYPTQKKQVDTAAGTMGEGFYNVFDSLTQGAKNLLKGRIIPFGPDRFRPQESERERESRYLKNMDPRELYLYNKQRGFTLDDINAATMGSPAIAEDIENIRYENPGVFFAGGGIAKEAGDRSGAMTTSMNPDSQGLSYLFNRVKKI